MDDFRETRTGCDKAEGDRATMVPKDGFYLDFFGLDRRPFTLLPDPGFMYWSPLHKRGYSVLQFGIMSCAPITVLTGEIGAGKTTLVQHLLSEMEDSITVGLISNAQGGRGELLQWVLHALGLPIENDASYVQLFRALQDFLVSEYAEGRRVVLIFDEAQNLTVEGLEEIRMLTNINANTDELIQLVLVGQPELRDLVLDPKMRQLTQRVAASFHLERMDEESVDHYIRHRMKIAGGSGEEFTEAACKQVFQQTRGVPRLVNQFCDFALLYAWTNETKDIDEHIVSQVVQDGVFFGGNSLEKELTV
ncbi:MULTISPECIES: ExeA family protein [unclassified Ruegeria]|uniref:ExeA family protein n=1 Tax=unclassified Ruegeria TaxID=2625375 RepID=UPI0020A5459E|nr:MULTISPECIES: AAA family ATPase [unclassified Ruegeria]